MLILSFRTDCDSKVIHLLILIRVRHGWLILRQTYLLMQTQEWNTDCDSETDSLTDADSEVEADCDSEMTLSETDSEFDTDCDLRLKHLLMQTGIRY